MIWFILVTMVSGKPNLVPYDTEPEVCEALAANQGAYAWQLEDGRKKVLTMGDCKPQVHFTTK